MLVQKLITLTKIGYNVTKSNFFYRYFSKIVFWEPSNIYFTERLFNELLFLQASIICGMKLNRRYR